MWCPNGLGHPEDQTDHRTVCSYRQWIEKLRRAGFRCFRSTMTWRAPLVDARWKFVRETVLSSARMKIMWSHFGVRNVFLVATK